MHIAAHEHVLLGDILMKLKVCLQSFQHHGPLFSSQKSEIHAGNNFFPIHFDPNIVKIQTF